MGAEVARWLYICAVVMYSGMLYMLFARAIWRGSSVLAVIYFWLASALPLLIIGVGVERRSFVQMVDPTIQSWAALFGDTLLLPFFAAMLAVAWRTLPLGIGEVAGLHNLAAGPQGDESLKPPWYERWWWRLLPLVFGIGVGLLMHLREAEFYTTLAFNSPTKLFHDIGSYSALVGGLTLTGQYRVDDLPAATPPPPPAARRPYSDQTSGYGHPDDLGTRRGDRRIPRNPAADDLPSFTRADDTGAGPAQEGRTRPIRRPGDGDGDLPDFTRAD